MALGGPEFELRIAGRSNLQQRVVASIVKFDARDRLGVAAIEIFRQAKNRGEPPHDLASLPPEQAEVRMPARGRRAPVISGHECDRFDLIRLEAAEIAVLDQVVRMTMMALITDVDASVVKNRRVLEPFALFVRHPVDGARSIEQREREPGNLVRVIRPVAATFCQLDDAAATHVRIAIGLRDFLAVLGDVIEHQAFAQRQVAQADVVGVEPLEDRVEENSARHGEIRASRIEAGNLQPFFKIQRGQLFADAMNLFGGNSSIADGRGAFALASRDGAEAQDGARGPDHAIEARVGDLLQVFVELAFDVLDEFSFVA
jgi:hypothetical protein